MTGPIVAGSPRRPRHASFVFELPRLSGREVSLPYRLAGGPDPDLSFEERLLLPPEVPAPLPGDPVAAALLDGLHRAAGVSYYKAAVPERIVAEPVPEEEAAFWDVLYTEGLLEFWFTNGIDPRRRVRFPRGGERPPVPVRAAREERALLLWGGGKDSAVAGEALRHAGVAADALSVGSAPALAGSAAASGHRHLSIGRALDPALLALNERGALNGHVPISAIIAFAAALTAHAGGYSEVVAANEGSADEGNLTWNGHAVNHQWSKSLEFERRLARWLATRSVGIRVGSLLRPLGELSIARAFARHDRYFETIASCNRNFRQTGAGLGERWCGRCPKCVFVRLCLAPFLPDTALARIFPADFLAAEENLPILAALVGVGAAKPFECVGTTEESRAALGVLAARGRLAGAAARWYGETPAARIEDPEAALERNLGRRWPHLLDETREARLDAYLGTR